METRITFCGLDSAGKTAILKFIESGEEVKTQITMGHRMQILPDKQLRIIVRDMGGQEIYRKSWNEFVPVSDIIVYVVDGANKDRIDESKLEFNKIKINAQKILFLVNKQDLDDTIEKKEVIDFFELNDLPIPWHIEETSALTGEGIRDALNWIYEQQTNEKITPELQFKVPIEHIENGDFLCLYRHIGDCKKALSMCKTCLEATCANCMNYDPVNCADKQL